MPHTNDLQDQGRLVLHVLNAQRHLVGARVGAASSPDEQDGVRRAVSDIHLLAGQWLPLFGPGHLRPGLALWGGTAHSQAWLFLRAGHHCSLACPGEVPGCGQP